MDSLIFGCVGIFAVVFVGGFVWSEIQHERQWRDQRPSEHRRKRICQTAFGNQPGQVKPTIDDLLDGRVSLTKYVESLDGPDRYDLAAREQVDRLDRQLDLRLRRKQLRAIMK